MERIIQLEAINTDYEPMETEMFIDMYEDDCCVGFGYTEISELDEDEMKTELTNIFNVLSELGCIVDRLKEEVIFTEKFCENYAKNYVNALKEYTEKLTPSDFALMKTRDEMEQLKDLMLFNDVIIYSDYLNIACDDFLSVVRSRFNPYNQKATNKVNNIPFKIVNIFYGN